MDKEIENSKLINIAIPNGNSISGSYAIIDGMNIALSRKSKNKGILNNVLKVYKKMQESYDHVEIIADASIIHNIDDKQTLSQSEIKQKIFICPAGIIADDLIWERALSLYSLGAEVTIVTNDKFPITRYSIEYENIRNLTVSILYDESIYLLERDILYLHNRDNGRTERIGIDCKIEYRDLMMVSE
jgi:hypothetical protein